MKYDFTVELHASGRDKMYKNKERRELKFKYKNQSETVKQGNSERETNGMKLDEIFIAIYIYMYILYTLLVDCHLELAFQHNRFSL